MNTPVLKQAAEAVEAADIVEVAQKGQHDQPELRSGDILVAEVIVETHPVLDGRVLVAGKDANEQQFELWLPCLAGLDIKAQDKVMLQRPGNTDEAVVTGILESSQLDRRQAGSSQSLDLALNQSVTINDHHGRALVDVVSGEDGPIVQLHVPMAELDVQGTLRLEADSLELKARQGEMSLSASGDIRVDGEMIKLN